MKKILFTERQLKAILGEDFSAYLDKSDNGCDYPAESNIACGGEVVTNDPSASEYPTLDKISQREYPRNPYTINRSHKLYEDKKKTLTERNHELDGKKFSLGKQTNDEIDANAVNMQNDKLTQNMSSENGATANCWYVRLNRLRKLKQTDPNRYEQLNGKHLEKSIEDSIKKATDLTKYTKPTISTTPSNIIVNVNKGTGKGHRKENSSKIYYENN